MIKDSLLYSSQIKRAIPHIISGINDHLKQSFTDDPVLKSASRSTTDMVTDTHAIKYATHKAKVTKGSQQTKYLDAVENLYRKFDLQFINKIAHDHSSFQMVSSRLHNVGTPNHNQPNRFYNLNLSTGKHAEDDFLVSETRANHIFSRKQYNLYQHPDDYKKLLLSSMKNAKAYIVKHPWKNNQLPRELFDKHSVAMRTLGLSDQHYYANAVAKKTGKQIQLPKGVYHIEDGYAIDTKQPAKQILKPKQIINSINDFQRNSRMMTGEDLLDYRLGHTREVHRSTTDDYQPTDYSKYGLPNKTFSKLYKYLTDRKVSSAQRMSRAVGFFNHYPKFADQLDIYSGSQAKRLLKSRTNGYHHDIGWFAHVGLTHTVFKQLKTDNAKKFHINDNFLYTGEQLHTLSAGSKPLSLRKLSQHIFAVLPESKQKQILKSPIQSKPLQYSKWSHLTKSLNHTNHHNVSARPKSQHRMTRQQKMAKVLNNRSVNR